jgi:hypothetical protein
MAMANLKESDKAGRFGTPGTATKKRRARQEEPQPGQEPLTLFSASVNEPSIPDSFRAVRIRLQRAGHPSTGDTNRLDLRSTSELAARQAPPPAMKSTGQVPERGGPASICHGFFSKSRSSRPAESIPLMPAIDCRPTTTARDIREGRACSPFSRAPGVFVVRSCVHSERVCRGGDESCICPWCLTRKSIKQDQAQMLALYREAKIAGYVVDPSD